MLTTTPSVRSKAQICKFVCHPQLWWSSSCGATLLTYKSEKNVTPNQLIHAGHGWSKHLSCTYREHCNCKDVCLCRDNTSASHVLSGVGVKPLCVRAGFPLSGPSLCGSTQGRTEPEAGRGRGRVPLPFCNTNKWVSSHHTQP